MSSILSNPITPCVVLGSIFGVAGHYFETKPQIILFGIIAIFFVQYYSGGISGEQFLQTDIDNLRDENENLKKNLVQVYAMVQQQKQTAHSGPPPPIPPSMTGVEVEKKEEEDEVAKPYL